MSLKLFYFELFFSFLLNVRLFLPAKCQNGGGGCLIMAAQAENNNNQARSLSAVIEKNQKPMGIS